jgi:signal transduction histidine kinase
MASYRPHKQFPSAAALQKPAAVRKAPLHDEPALLESNRLLQVKTSQLAAALRNGRRAEEALRDETRALELLNRIGRNLSSKLALPTVLQEVTDAGTEISGAEFGLFLWSAPALEQGAASGTAFSAARDAFSAALAQGRLAWNHTFYCVDLAHAPALRKKLLLSPEAGPHEPARSLIFIPLVSRAGDVLGALIFGHRAPRVFGDRTERILGGMAAQAVVAIDNARLYTQVTREMQETKLLSNLQADHLQRLRSLSRRLMLAEEQERKRLGRELHDRVGSNLSALLLSLELMRSELPPDAAAAVSRRLFDLGQTLQETMDHVRDVLGNLRPTALDELGLVPALRHQAAILTARSGVQFVFKGKELAPRMQAECEMAFFRIAQEAWANVLKHAHASRVELTIAQEGSLVSMRIEDDGCGIDPAARPPGSPGLGLTIMRERAEAIGAMLQIENLDDCGVRLDVVLDRGAAVPVNPA